MHESELDTISQEQWEEWQEEQRGDVDAMNAAFGPVAWWLENDGVEAEAA